VSPLTPIETAAAWVRDGYPDGAPRHGHIALVALCGADSLDTGDDRRHGALG